MTSLLFILLAAAAGFWIGRGQGRGEAARQMAALQSEVEARESRDRASQAASLSESQTALTRAQAACRAELDALNQRLAETRRQSEAAVAVLREEQALAASERQSLQQRAEALSAQVEAEAARVAALSSQLETAQVARQADDRRLQALQQSGEAAARASTALAREAYQAVKSLRDELAAERAAHAQTREQGGALAREAYTALRRAA